MTMPLPITDEAVRYIVANLRAPDREELSAASNSMDPDLWVEQMRPIAGYTSYFEHDGKPAVLVGAASIRQGVWSLYAFGTDDFDRCIIRLTRYLKHVMTPALISIGCHRAECDTIDTHVTSHAWLESLGLRRESIMPQYGRNRETFYKYVYQVEKADV